MTALAVVIVALLTTSSVVAANRLREPGELSVVAIDPEFTMLAVAPTVTLPDSLVTTLKAKPPAKTSAARGACPALPAVPAESMTAVRALVPRVKVFDKPGGRVVKTLTNPTHEGQPLHGLVRGRDGYHLRIQLVARPNGATGWVRMTDFAQFEVPYRIVVQRCAKKITVFRTGRQVWQRDAAVGKARTPTPTGEFFVDFITPMRCCTYGPMMLSVAGFSNVLHQFGKGGTGQIAIHGTSADWSVGKAASNGCVRLHNADVTALSKLVPPGTPVLIQD